MNKETHVLILNHYNRLSPRVEHEVITLSETGYQVHILSWARSLEPLRPVPLRDVLTTEIHHPAPHGTLRLLPHLLPFYYKVFRQLKGQRFDVVHCTHLMLLPLAVFLKRRWHAKMIYDVYEFHLQETKERLPKPFRWLVPLLQWLEGKLVRRTDGVLTIDSAAQELEHYYKRFQPNTAALYNVPDPHPSLDKGKLDVLRGKYANRRIVLYVGGLSEAKGALMALEAARPVIAKHQQVLFLFIGIFQEKSTEERFRKTISDYKLGDHVEFIPWLPYEEMLHYVAISEVGLALHQPIPRFFKVSKGNGRKFFTYMQFGIPVVGPEFGEVGQVVREEGCGLLVDTTNPQAIAQAICHLLSHTEEARRMGERGRRAIQTRYNWSQEKRKLLRVYERALQTS
jgi:glycosyltransferase involved in cell wall biosynthesis